MTSGQDSVEDGAILLRDQLVRISALISSDTERPVLDAIGQILDIADEVPAHRALALGFLFSEADAFRRGHKRIRLPDAFSSRANIVDAHLEFALDENLPVHDFYRMLDGLLDMPQFAGRDERILALYWLVIDKQLPYFQLADVDPIGDEQWSEGISSREDDLALTRHVFARKIPSKWAEADQLRRILASHATSDEDRNFLIAFIIDGAQARGYDRGYNDGKRE
ncbi:MAG: hypothetical protein QM662_01545 [Gordonia sp. (in: high G+C Gram-positive bacteria)]